MFLDGLWCLSEIKLFLPKFLGFFFLFVCFGFLRQAILTVVTVLAVLDSVDQAGLELTKICLPLPLEPCPKFLLILVFYYSIRKELRPEVASLYCCCRGPKFGSFYPHIGRHTRFHNCSSMGIQGLWSQRAPELMYTYSASSTYT